MKNFKIKIETDKHNAEAKALITTNGESKIFTIATYRHFIDGKVIKVKVI